MTCDAKVDIMTPATYMSKDGKRRNFEHRWNDNTFLFYEVIEHYMYSLQCLPQRRTVVCFIFLSFFNAVQVHCAEKRPLDPLLVCRSQETSATGKCDRAFKKRTRKKKTFCTLKHLQLLSFTIFRLEITIIVLI